MKLEPTLKNVNDPNFGVPPKAQNSTLQQLGAPHITSFNYMVDEGLKAAVDDLLPVEFKMPAGDKITLMITDASLSCPVVPVNAIGVKKTTILPSECRQAKRTYKGKCNVRVSWFVNDREQTPFIKEMGDLPIMIKSNRCHLQQMTPEQLVKSGEHEQEWGGAFVIKGLERLVRMLLMTRRNYPVAVKRSTWKMRGALFSECGVSIRCVKEDQTATNNVIHFVTDGTAKLMFSYRKNLYYVPLVLILKCLYDCSDAYIYKKLTEGFEEDLYYCDCVQNMLRAVHQENLHTHDECKAYLGKIFRVKLWECPDWYTDVEVTDFIIKNCLLIHLPNNLDKFNMLAFMCKKLFVFAQNKCKVEGVDSVMMQELLLGGHLYLQILKEKLQLWLHSLRTTILKKAASNPNFSLTQSEIQSSARFAGSLESAFESFLATGNISTPSGLGLMQTKGLTIVPENINRMRYMSHFKAVHRGAFFMEMRTTEVRQLLPDAWGFICPVHTPDGAPCGLLNHLTLNCSVTDVPEKSKAGEIPAVLEELGMVHVNASDGVVLKDYYVTQVDGRIVGYVHKEQALSLTKKLRIYKIEGKRIPYTTEIVLVPFKKTTAQFPGLFLFTGAARMMRPVINLSANKVEFIGTFEQIYIDICIKPEEHYEGVTTHMELSKNEFLSNLAQLIPMPDCNQSPRNMYQCQMGKQTMGTPCHNWDLQAETKLYRLQTPSTPLFRPVHHDNIDLDDFAMGTNAIVAVISYTGYDMEDAMIINKSSYERGFAHGSIYKSDFFELKHASSFFCRDPTQDETLKEYMDTDGLPYIGRPVKSDEPLYCYFDSDESKFRVVKFKGKEDCFVNSVRLCGDFNIKKPRIACITFRVERNPSVGDKFASRAGQKGICSQKWPSEDLPFTESGLVPDIVFNPHGFPSRMTIAMMIEIMAGKSAAIHGLVHDATPFKFSEKNTAIDHFGRLLEAGGYNYYGTETMYSGIDGREMKAQIFFGIVHYQRLRHMVSDKFQVRSTGPLDVLTRQPIKGRKRGGGVRFGEMERDSLISHGASFLLQDRLLHCSDKTTAFICTSCNSILGPVTLVTRVADKPYLSETKEHCRFCGHGNDIAEIQVPYIFKFFVTQLASCNINIKIECKKI